jgi:hypothetical protein
MKNIQLRAVSSRQKHNKWDVIESADQPLVMDWLAKQVEDAKAHVASVFPTPSETMIVIRVGTRYAEMALEPMHSSFSHPSRSISRMGISVKEWDDGTAVFSTSIFNDGLMGAEWFWGRRAPDGVGYLCGSNASYTGSLAQLGPDEVRAWIDLQKPGTIRLWRGDDGEWRMHALMSDEYDEMVRLANAKGEAQPPAKWL